MSGEASEGLRARPEFKAGWRVGVYGGSFDPVHVGHLETVQAAVADADLDHVLFLPTAYPPHKWGVEQVPARQRFAMVELAVSDLDHVSVLDDEMAEQPSYSIDTLERLSEEFPSVEFVLMVGADSYHDLPKWKDWRRIVAGWDLVVLPRPGWALEPGALPDELRTVLAQQSGRKQTLMSGPLIGASSTEVRRRLKAGKSLPSGWLPTPVLDFIRAHDLYQSAENLDQSDPPESDNGLTTTPSANDASNQADTPATTFPLPPEVALAAYTALDRQAIDLVLLEVTAVCDFADYFIVCSGNTDRQVAAIAQAIQRALRKIKVKPLHVEGERRGNWVLVDYGHLIVHIFDPSTRDFYRLERLWDDAPRVPASLYAETPTTRSDAAPASDSGSSGEEE